MFKDLSIIFFGILGLFAVIALIMGISYAHKEYHTATTPISVSHPQSGYICFLAASDTALGLSCIKE